MILWQKLLWIALLVLTGNASAREDVLVDKVWLRESVQGQGSASLQLTLTATRPAQLIGVSSPWATAVEIQRLFPNRGRIESRVVKSLRLPRNRAIAFGEHSITLMMVGLKQPLKVGDQVPVSLTVELPGKQVRIVEVEAEVKALALSYKHLGGEEVHDQR